MKVFIVGISGGVGYRVAQRLKESGHTVTGMVRKAAQADQLAREGIMVAVADLVQDSVETLAASMVGNDIILFTAGAGDGDFAATTAVDGDGPAKAAAAAKIAGVQRFYLVSVFPEAWRERRMDEDFEHYLVEKKKAETQLVLADLDWVIVRPAALTNDPGTGTVDLGLAKVHHEIPRDDVANTLVALMEEPGIRRVILEVTGGSTPIRQAVAALKA